MNETLIKLRKEAGLTQIDLAHMCGWPPNNGRVSQYETGETQITCRVASEILEVLQAEMKRKITIKEKLSLMGAGELA